MGEDRPESRESLEGTSADYSYDMAHDADTEPHEHHRVGTAHHTGRGASDPPPPDPEGDYSYDLAHEVPPAER